MHRLLSFLLAFTLFVSALADDLPDPAQLPEKEKRGDMDPEYPAEMARRLRDGKAFLEAGELEKAEEELAKAEKAAVHQMVYFYQAVVAYRLGDYPRALQRANEGFGVLRDIRAYGNPTPETEAQEKRFVELRDAIQAKLDATGGKAAPDPRKVKQEFDAALKEANDAFAQGLLAKAAAAYARAFRLDPAQGELGLRAAGLYADRLKNPLEAARLWQQVLAGGEPHASAARLELQSHRDALDGVLTAGLARRHQWRGTGPAEPLKLAEAFPESTDLQVEIALVYAFKGQADAMIKHLQAASRLGMGLDEFRTQKEFLNFFEVSGVDNAVGQSLAAFLRDAYGDETIIAAIRTEVKRRADEVARLAREKAERERQARIAAELKELSAWRNGERGKAANEINQLISARNNTEVEVIYLRANPDPRKRPRNFVTNNARFSWDGRAYALSTELNSRSVRSNGAVNGTNRSERYTFASTAAYAGLDVRSSTGLQLYIDEDFRIVEPHRALYRLIDCKFRSQVVRQDSEWRNIDGELLSPAGTTTGWSATFNVMLTDQEVARLQWLFSWLSQLDGAGDNVEILRRLRR